MICFRLNFKWLLAWRGNEKVSKPCKTLWLFYNNGFLFWKIIFISRVTGTFTTSWWWFSLVTVAHGEHCLKRNYFIQHISPVPLRFYYTTTGFPCICSCSQAELTLYFDYGLWLSKEGKDTNGEHFDLFCTFF